MVRSNYVGQNVGQSNGCAILPKLPKNDQGTFPCVVDFTFLNGLSGKSRFQILFERTRILAQIMQ